jgi:hypothetical protein
MKDQKLLSQLLANIAIKKALDRGKFWKWKMWESKVIWLLKLRLYQDPTRFAIGIGYDFSERPVVFMINIFFWAMEVNIFTNKNQIY